VVNSLLAELDGVQGLRGVVVLAATSRPDLIDAALLRPGRLDRCVECGMPGPTQRTAIAAALSRQLPLEPHADPGAVAATAEGLNGADIAAALGDAQLAAVHQQLDAAGDTSSHTTRNLHLCCEVLSLVGSNSGRFLSLIRHSAFSFVTIPFEKHARSLRTFLAHCTFLFLQLLAIACIDFSSCYSHSAFVCMAHQTAHI
jgi:SpoVK/Ycf46/Vps4 family AAA+-type ATPase